VLRWSAYISLGRHLGCKRDSVEGGRAGGGGLLEREVEEREEVSFGGRLQKGGSGFLNIVVREE
jgi:hypothetical protein